jgi:hypothetical protein
MPRGGKDLHVPTTSITLAARKKWSFFLSPRGQSPLTRPAPAVWSDWLPVFLVIGVALALAVVQYRQFLDVHRQLWYSGAHDRNAHYLFSLRLAGDLRDGRVGHWLESVNSARVWPPLYALLAYGALLVGGFDYRLAVWPSLVGWWLAMVFGFLAAGRMVPRGGNLAGALAVLFIGLSPAHRAYSTDVMLESLGAGLSLVVLYAYLVSVQGDSGRSGRWLGLALTALFLLKYNYWLLVLLALGVSETWSWRQRLWSAGWTVLRAVDWRRLAWTELSRVSNWAILTILVATGVVYARGDRPLVILGREIGLYPPFNLLQVVYWIAFVRLLVWWRSAGRTWADGLDVRVGHVIRWHLWPVAWWMALPKHIGPFLWFLSPSNAGETQQSSLAAGLSDYAGWALTDYHVSLACASIAAALFLIALLATPALRRGGVAVLLLVLIGTFLAAKHPNRKGRFLHSWIAAGWVCGGAGVALLIYGRVTARLPRVRPWLACAAVGGVTFAHFAGGFPTAHAAEGGPHPELPCLLDVTDSYLPDLDGNQTVVVLPGVAVWPQVQWTFLERNGRLERLEDHRTGFGPVGEANRQAFREWLSTNRVATIVFIEAMPGPQAITGWEPISEVHLHEELRDLLEQQRVFRLARSQEFPRHGCVVTLWKRAE